MKKLRIVLALLLILSLAGCAVPVFIPGVSVTPLPFPTESAVPSELPGTTPAKSEIDPTQVQTFMFEIGGFGIMNVYEVGKTNLTFNKYKKGGGASKDPVKTVKWDAAKWDAFVNVVLSCNVSQWKDEYMNKEIYDGTQWGLTLSGGFGSREIRGSNDYPAEWEQFRKILSEHFGETIQ